MTTGQFSKEGWKTVRLAMQSWAQTARFIAILLALSAPVVGASVIVRLAIPM